MMQQDEATYAYDCDLDPVDMDNYDPEDVDNLF